MLQTILGIKLGQDQAWTKSGVRVPVTKIQAGPCVVTQIKTQDKDGYTAVQLGLGDKKIARTTLPLMGHFKKALGGEAAPRWLREVRLKAEEVELKLGGVIKANEVISAGDMVNVTGKSLGKGFAGVVKRWRFKGGPKTHGQSDRHRAPGSIGQGTDPGRVHKGKKMAGHMGDAVVTVRNLTVLKVDETNGEVWLKGQVPGAKNGLVVVKKVGIEKKFEGLLEEALGGSDAN